MDPRQHHESAGEAPGRRASGEPIPTPTALITRTHRVWLDGDGIVHAEILPDTELTLADSEAGLAAIWEVGGRQRRPILLDTRAIKSLDRDARAHSAGAAMVRVVRAGAILVGSPLTLAIANFFMVLHKPPVPTRMFTNEAEALLWLRGFRA